MKKTDRFIAQAVIFAFLLATAPLPAESIDDVSSQITPKHTPGSGEYVHGQGYNKILIRILIFGAISQQGIHYVPEGTDLLFAILYSGGYSETSKLSGITIRRRGVKDLIEVSLDNLIEDGTPIPKLLEGDVVTIPFNWRRDITTIGTITGFFTAMSTFVLTLIALNKKN